MYLGMIAFVFILFKFHTVFKKKKVLHEILSQGISQGLSYKHISGLIFFINVGKYSVSSSSDIASDQFSLNFPLDTPIIYL